VVLPLHPRASACGKVILVGEHAVVHGYPAVAAGLPGGVELTAEALPDPRAPIELRIGEWELDLELTATSEHPVARACLEVLGHCDGPVAGWRIRGRSALPARAGLGSSAALTVALARLALGPGAADADVVEASLAGERVFHGRPSGIDSEVAARGGVLEFARGRSVQAIVLGAPLRLAIVPSGIPRSTADQIARVQAQLARLPVAGAAALSCLGAAVRESRAALEAGDPLRLGALMDLAHGVLGGLGASSAELDRLCARARAAGALGAKLTGAGGGGCIVALLPPDRETALEPAAPGSPAPFTVEVAP
jgi:mevalonate kinase